jgi:hypothetical protein
MLTLYPVTLVAIEEGLADERLRKRNIEEDAKRREAEEAEVRRTACADARRAQRPRAAGASAAPG